MRFAKAGLLSFALASSALLVSALPTSREAQWEGGPASGIGASSGSGSGSGSGSDVEVATPTQGTFVGTRNQTTGQEYFHGIPYAQAPLGELRFQQTKPLRAYTGNRKRRAKEFGNLCIQTNNSTFRGRVEFSEDCLFLNIQRPARQDERLKLPVLVWIHGGSWKDGGSSQEGFEPTNLIRQSVRLGRPIIHVAINYRLGVFGNLLGPGVDAADKEGSAALNAAYYDQRQALRWLQENIEGFGGDRKRVTIWGESSGANSVAAQLLADEGDLDRDCKGCFSNAFLASGSQATAPRLDPTAIDAAQSYGALLKRVGCPAETAEDITSSAGVDCLRKVDAVKLQAAAVAISGGSALFIPVLDRKFVSELPSSQLAKGMFAKVPIISGNVLDEGTSFAALSLKGNVNTTTFKAGIVALHRVKDEGVLEKLAKLYPDEPAIGSPFESELVGASSGNRFFGPTHQYKRSAAAEGDLLFHAGRRQHIGAALSKGVPVYSYLFALPSPVTVLPGTESGPFLGVPHASDVLFMYGNTPRAAPATPANSTTVALAKYASQKDLDRQSDIFTSALLHFVHTGNPNGKTATGLAPRWPRYHQDSKELLQVQGTYNTTVITDTFREHEIDFILANAPAFHM